jgi:hypothetical protein
MRQWRTYNEKYEVSDDGMVRLTIPSSAGPAGRWLLPGWSGGSAIYFVHDGGARTVRQVCMTFLVCSAWGRKCDPWTLERFTAAREEAVAVNAAISPQFVARAKAMAAVDCFRPKKEELKTDFASMITNCEVSSWDDPRMGPMTCRIAHAGVWFEAAPVAQEVAA